ncbi:SpoIIIAH-like family protein [Eubacterium sp. MSJ-13]|uniref:SpoIIIAH-like family protein n=1 Tax=Eubacterium sp. MSJ-13 TaxID=2841513 RepID=UPI001C1107C4|nr:SpoIIIAH-like family protein [Eubacterium sp. MSJ-13]MBU5479242.1 SpoIIIAH-like family protein [Eubacterium sp. MSJ-13]
MKKSSHKNGIVITALALMIIAAGYLNFTGQKISTNGITARTTASPDVTSEDTADISADDIGTDTSGDSDGKNEEDAQKDSEYTITDSGEVLASEENPGEAVMVSNNIGSDYFASSKLNREQTRAKNKETLMNIINDDKISSADKKSAIKQVAAMTKISEKENAAELMLQAKGFENAMVSISDGNADVIVSSEGLTNQQIAQIEDIVKRKTGIAADKIVITPVNVK